MCARGSRWPLQTEKAGTLLPLGDCQVAGERLVGGVHVLQRRPLAHQLLLQPRHLRAPPVIPSTGWQTLQVWSASPGCCLDTLLHLALDQPASARSRKGISHAGILLWLHVGTLLLPIRVRYCPERNCPSDDQCSVCQAKQTTVGAHLVSQATSCFSRLGGGSSAILQGVAHDIATLGSLLQGSLLGGRCRICSGQALLRFVQLHAHVFPLLMGDLHGHIQQVSSGPGSDEPVRPKPYTQRNCTTCQTSDF